MPKRQKLYISNSLQAEIVQTTFVFLTLHCILVVFIFFGSYLFCRIFSGWYTEPRNDQSHFHVGNSLNEKKRTEQKLIGGNFSFVNIYIIQNCKLPQKYPYLKFIVNKILLLLLSLRVVRQHPKASLKTQHPFILSYLKYWCKS